MYDHERSRKAVVRLLTDLKDVAELMAEDGPYILTELTCDNELRHCVERFMLNFTDDIRTANSLNVALDL